MVPEPRRALICLRYGIGDLVMQWPALEALRRTWPDAHIVAVGAEPAIELLEGDPLVDERVSVHRFGLSHWGDWGDPERRAAIAAWVRAGEFDVILDPSHAVVGLGQAVWSLNHGRLLDTGHGLKDGFLEQWGSGAAAIREAVLEGWGITVTDTQPRLRLGESERRFARDFMAGHGLAGAEVFAVSPVASSPLKRWPLERLAAVARHAIHSGMRVLLFGGGDADLERRWRDVAKGVAWWSVPRIHLRKTAALLAASRILVCNDTGLMHLAAAVGTPTLGVFGPTSPRIYRPLGADAVGGTEGCIHRREAAFGPPYCVATGSCLMGWRSCIDTVSVEDVRERLKGSLASPAA